MADLIGQAGGDPPDSARDGGQQPWLSILDAYAAIARELARAESLTGFKAAPVFAAGDGRAVEPAEIGVSLDRLFALMRAGVLPDLKEKQRELYRILTSVFHVPGPLVRDYVRDFHGLEIDEKTGAPAPLPVMDVNDDDGEEDEPQAGEDDFPDADDPVSQ